MILVGKHLFIIIVGGGFVAQIVKTGGEPLVSVHELVLFAYVEEAEPAVGGFLVKLHLVVCVREGGVLVRRGAVQIQRFVQQAQRGEIVPVVDARIRHVEQRVRA